jgi:hypothetical protein
MCISVNIVEVTVVIVLLIVSKVKMEALRGITLADAEIV